MTSFVFSGSSHPVLANQMADYLGTALGKRELHLFPDGEIYVEILESVQKKDVFIIQSLGEQPNYHLMETLIMVDALRRASAASITLILPYYAYARQDRINTPGTPITAKLVADLVTKAGVDELITLDLHSEAIEGFFDIPVHHLLSSSVVIPYCKRFIGFDDVVVVAPDKGSIKIAGVYAKALNAPLALIDKERIDSFHVEMRLFVGDVNGKTVILPDDMCATAGTLVSAAQVCAELGAKRIIAVVAHGLLIENAMERINNSPIEMLIMTNSIPVPERVSNHPKIKVISIAPLLSGAIGLNR